MKLAELPEILVTGGKNNFASYLLQKNETKKIGNSLEQSLTGSTSFKLQGRVIMISKIEERKNIKFHQKARVL